MTRRRSGGEEVERLTREQLLICEEADFTKCGGRMVLSCNVGALERRRLSEKVVEEMEM